MYATIKEADFRKQIKNEPATGRASFPLATASRSSASVPSRVAPDFLSWSFPIRSRRSALVPSTSARTSEA